MRAPRVHERTGSVASRLCEASSMVSAVHCPSDSGSATSELAGKEESKQSGLRERPQVVGVEGFGLSARGAHLPAGASSAS